MRVLILAGGKGNRVSPVYKPLVCILGKPIIDILLNQLKGFEVYININKEDINKLKNYENRIKFLIEDKRMGKARPLLDFIEKYNEDFLLIHCDCYTDLNFKKFIEISQNNKELMIMSVKDIAKQKAFGVAIFDKHNLVYGFTRRRYINMGIYFIRKEIKKYIKENIWQDIDETLIPDLIRDKQLKVYIHKGFFFDIGTRRVIEKFSNRNKNA